MSTGAADAVVRAACAITDTDASCFTASWYLVWDQVRYWLLFQTPIVAASVVFEWLELARLPHIERLRTAFDAPLTRTAINLLQLVTCAYVCIAWIVRGGSLAVSFSSWSIESALLIATAVAYGIQWVAAKQKVHYTLQLASLVDLLSIVSHFALSFQKIASQTGSHFQLSWLDFGFLRAFVAYTIIDDLFERYATRHATTSFVAQVLRVVVKALSLVFTAACVLFSLERLGDMPATSDSFLLHVFKCSNADGTQTMLLPTAKGSDAFPDCTETWSVFASIYFLFVTVSTVGYGDFSPKTVAGQLIVCFIIMFGIYTFANESAAFVQLYGDALGGKSHGTSQLKYNVSRHAKHVIVTGNPSFVQLKDFIREFFHPDHFEQTNDDDDGFNTATGSFEMQNSTTNDVDTMEQGHAGVSTDASSSSSRFSPRRTRRTNALETHIVVLFRFEQHEATVRALQTFVRDDPLYHKRVVLLDGSPLVASDVLERAQVRHATAVFCLPNKFARDGNQEDAATVLRVLAITQQLVSQRHHKSPQLFAMLVNSDNRTLVEATGLRRDHVVCIDALRLSLMGLSCRCPGLSTLVSNLITSRSGCATAGVGKQHATWREEYVAGAANEIYACHLASRFRHKSFTDAAQRIFTQSNGLVLLLAVQDQDEDEDAIAFNPGPKWIIRSTSRAFLIAESTHALAPFTSTESIQAPEAQAPWNRTLVQAQQTLVQRARRAQHAVERRIPLHIRSTMAQCGSSTGSLATGSIDSSSAIQPPPASLLQHGGHIVVCCNNAETHTTNARSLARLVHLLQPLRAPHVARPRAIVLVDAQRLDARASRAVQRFANVFHVWGSPQRHEVLVAAGVDAASAVVVLAQSNSTGSTGASTSNTTLHDGDANDAKTIFNAVLIHATLRQQQQRQTNQPIFTLLELRDVANNRFLDPVARFRDPEQRIRTTNDVLNDVDARLDDSSDNIEQTSRASMERVGTTLRNRQWQQQRLSATSTQKRYRQKRTWFERQWIALQRFVSTVRAFFLGNLLSAAHRVRTFQATTGDSTGDTAIDNGLDDSDTFFQERFMRGALFPSAVADELLVQSFFNPTLNGMIRQLLDGQRCCLMLYAVPKAMRQRYDNAPLTYATLFAYWIASAAHALPIGLLRAGVGTGHTIAAPHAYVYTCPAASTCVDAVHDKVFVLLDVQALHCVANTLQRWARNCRRRHHRTQQ